MERNHEFTLKFAVPVRTTAPDDWIEELAEAGCNDALIGTGIPGRLALDFDRVSSDADSALRSAVADVQRAIPEARLIEAGPDYVGLTEIADLLGISRQAMRKTMAKNIEQFPLPVHDGNPSIWHLKDVLQWMRGAQAREIDDSLMEIAETTYALNERRQELAA